MTRFASTPSVRSLVRSVALPLCLAVAWPVLADSKPQHYEAAAPATPQEAATVLSTTVSDIGKAFAARDFEAIHKISYSTEKAVQVLAASPTADPGLFERLAHTVEIVHLASEIPSPAILAAAIPELEDASRKAAATH